MEIIKKANGTIWLVENNKLDKILPATAIVEVFDKNEIIVKQGMNQFTSFFVSQITSTQIEPAAPIPFSGDVEDLMLILSDFFFELSGGGGDVEPIYLGEFAAQPVGTPTELSYFFNTTQQRFFYSDFVRGKWLSFDNYTETIGSSINLSAGSYFRLEGVSMSPVISGILPVYPCTLCEYSFTRQNATSSVIWVYEGNTIPPISGQGLQFSTINFATFDTTANVDFSGGVIVGRNATNGFGGGLVSQPILTLKFRFRFNFI